MNWLLVVVWFPLAALWQWCWLRLARLAWRVGSARESRRWLRFWAQDVITHFQFPYGRCPYCGDGLFRYDCGRDYCEGRW